MKRRGSTIIEATVALCVVAAAIGAAARMLSASARQRQASDLQMAALIELNNVAEQIAGSSYDELTPGTVDGITLSKEAQATLPSAKLAIALTEVSAPEPPHKRLHLELSWSAIGGEPRTVRLTTWKYASAREEKP